MSNFKQTVLSKVGSIGELQAMPMFASGLMCWRAKALPYMLQGAFIYPPCERLTGFEDKGLTEDRIEDIDWILNCCPDDCEMITQSNYKGMFSYRIITDRGIGIEVKTNRQTHGDNGNPRTTQFTQNIPLELIQNTSLYNRNQTKTGTDARTGKQFTYIDGIGWWNKFGTNEDEKNDWFIFYQPLKVRIDNNEDDKSIECRCKYASQEVIQRWFDDDSINDEDILIVRYPVDYAIIVSGRTLWKIENIGQENGRPFRTLKTSAGTSIEKQLELIPVRYIVPCYNMQSEPIAIKNPAIGKFAGYEPARIIPIPMFFKHKDRNSFKNGELERVARHRYIKQLINPNTARKVYIPNEIKHKDKEVYTAFDSGSRPKWGDKYREWFVPVDIYNFFDEWNAKSY